jgi:hypothetical protein
MTSVLIQAVSIFASLFLGSEVRISTKPSVLYSIDHNSLCQLFAAHIWL